MSPNCSGSARADQSVASELVALAGNVAQRKWFCPTPSIVCWFQISAEFRALHPDFQDVISDICQRMGSGMLVYSLESPDSMEQWDNVRVSLRNSFVFLSSHKPPLFGKLALFGQFIKETNKLFYMYIFEVFVL